MKKHSDKELKSLAGDIFFNSVYGPNGLLLNHGTAQSRDMFCNLSFSTFCHACASMQIAGNNLEAFKTYLAICLAANVEDRIAAHFQNYAKTGGGKMAAMEVVLAKKTKGSDIIIRVNDRLLANPAPGKWVTLLYIDAKRPPFLELAFNMK